VTKNEMIQLAREAGWQYANGDDGYGPLWKFGELVAAAEREECAKVCDDIDEEFAERGRTTWCSAAIRSRGQK